MAALLDIQRLEGHRDRIEAGDPPPFVPVSSAMLYQMACSIEDRTRVGAGVLGLRSALKGFYNCGVCLESSWPSSDPRLFDEMSEAAASEARNLGLGAYYRVPNVLNDYHAAIREAGALLVSATVHDGWFAPVNGRIELRRTGPSQGHAFVVAGYNAEGFIVLNSFGRDWGGFTHEGVRLPGVALWSYEDWAGSVRDAWVLRLGVPAPGAFRFSVGSFGKSAEAEQAPFEAARDLKPRRQTVIGRYLSFAEGTFQTTGTYPTTEKTLATTLDILDERQTNSADSPYYGDVLLVFNGTPEEPGKVLDRLGRKIAADKNAGIYRIALLWANDLLQGTSLALTPLFAQALAQKGRPGPECDALIEKLTHPVGRAVWRDVKRQARQLARDPDGTTPGSVGSALFAIVDLCLRTRRRLHFLAEGAGVLALEALISDLSHAQYAAARDSLMSALCTLQCVAPTITAKRFAETFEPFLTGWKVRRPSAEMILMRPDHAFEERFGIFPYTKSWSHLIQAAFEDDERPLLSLAGASALFASDGLRIVSLAPPRDGPLGLEDVLDHSAAEAHLRWRIRASSLPPIGEETPRLPSPDEAGRADALAAGADRITLRDLERAALDPAVPEKSLAPFFRASRSRSAPFAPVFEPDPAKVDLSPDNVRVARGEIAIPFANNLSRKRRQIAFQTKLALGYEGPIIVSEGDSWFQFPFQIEDVVDHLSDEFAVWSLDAAGDTLQGMVAQAELVPAVLKWKASAVLLSGGGNDALGNGRLADLLYPYDPGKSAAAHLRGEFAESIGAAMARYQTIIEAVRNGAGDTPVICHGYDYAVPADGRWLGKPMTRLGFPPSKQAEVVKEMIDIFNVRLKRLSKRFGRVTVLDNRGVVPAGEWEDELHPTDEGFARIARRFRTAIRKAFGHGSRAAVSARGRVPRRVPADIEVEQPTPTRSSAGAPVGRSLHIGVNRLGDGYYGSLAPLRGCVNDAEDFAALAQGLGYSATMLVDEAATRKAVARAIMDAAAETGPEDVFLLTYSGHGSTAEDLNGDEVSGHYDSTWCLHDEEMVDDEFTALWARFPAGARIVMVSDSCHSGSVVAAPADLPKLQGEPVGTSRRLPQSAEREITVNRRFRKRAPLLATETGVELPLPPGSAIQASVRLLAACQDDQLAYEAAGERANGNFTRVLVDALKTGFNGTHAGLRDLAVERLAPAQTPNHMSVGRLSDSFDGQAALSISVVAAAEAMPLRDGRRSKPLRARGIVNSTRLACRFDPFGSLDLGRLNDFQDQSLAAAVRARADLLAQLGAAVGRVWLGGSLGTAFLVAPDLVMTNNHVAAAFSRNSTQYGPWTRSGQPLFEFGGISRGISEAVPQAVIGPADERNVTGEIRTDRLDLVLVRLHAPIPGLRMPLLDISRPLAQGEPVAVIGFPALPWTEEEAAWAKTVFGADYAQSKWLSAGYVQAGPGSRLGGSGPADPFAWIVQHDASVLRGSSGSMLVSLATGLVAGIHFATFPGGQAPPVSNCAHLLNAAARHRPALFQIIDEANRPQPPPFA